MQALYGLKQAPHTWYEKKHAYLTTHGFQNSPTERTLYVKYVDDVHLIIALYVNEMLLTRCNESQIVDLNASF